MRIHSDTLTLHDLSMATSAAGMRGVYLLGNTPRVHESRSRARAYEVRLGGNSPYRTQGDRDVNAATWDEWGIFLADLFRRDMKMVSPYYLSLDHFVWTTAGRFTTLQWPDQHKRHQWVYEGRCVTGAYDVHVCKKCSARTRRLVPPHTWAEIAD